MAGIGFKLKNYFMQDDLSGVLKGLMLSFVVASGPWLLTIFSVAILNYFSADMLKIEDNDILKTIFSHCFAIGLIIFGLFEYLIIRHAANIYFKGKSRNIFRFMLISLAFMSCATFILCFMALKGLMAPDDYFWQMQYLIIFLVLNWVLSVFVSFLKCPTKIAFAYFYSFVLIGGGGYLLKDSLSVEYILNIFLSGQVSIFLYLFLILKINLNLTDSSNQLVEFKEFFVAEKRLCLIGFFYYLGIWVDKFIFWGASDTGYLVTGNLRTSYFYDGAFFIAYLTIIPSMVYFIVSAETNFYVDFKKLFSKLEGKMNLRSIENCIGGTQANLKTNLASMVQIQFAFSFLCFLFAEEIMVAFNQPYSSVPIFKVALFGAFANIIFLHLNIYHMYFKNDGLVLKLNFLFFSLNLIFTLITKNLGADWYGHGYLFASSIVAICSFLYLDQHFKSLLFNIFSNNLPRNITREAKS